MTQPSEHGTRKAPTMRQLRAMLEAHRKEVAKTRDNLREFFSDVKDLLGTCNAAAECIEQAADHLSEVAITRALLNVAEEHITNAGAAEAEVLRRVDAFLEKYA